MNDRARRLVSQIVAVAVGLALIAFLRNRSGDGDGPTPPPGTTRTDCVALSLTASSEKAALMATIADAFNRSQPSQGACATVSVNTKASGEAMDALARGWDDSLDGPRPDIWSPAASTWVVLLRQRLAARDATGLVPDDVPTIAFSPLVIAMPRPMATALGWPDADIGWSDVLSLATDPQGWGSVGHPEWGAFKLGKTNPNFSTSGLHALVGSYFAATGLTSDLTLKDIRSPQVRDFVGGVESSVYHYGDITLTFLANLQAADDRGAGLSYISAVAVEEKSVWDYNQGNPSGDPATLGDHGPPSQPLVAIYPDEGTLISDHPYVVLQAPWVDDAKRAAAASFLEFLRKDAQQDRFRSFAFRGFDGTAGPLTTEANGLLPGQPARILRPPAPEVLDAALRSWSELRKRARVIVMIDVSGSMEDAAGNGYSKIELARLAAVKALGSFQPDDAVALWSFSGDSCREEVPLGEVAGNRAPLQKAIEGLHAGEATPLYECVRQAVDRMRGEDDARINGVVVLSDGMNSVGPGGDDCLDCLIDYLDDPELNVRVFPIAYGADADLTTLKAIAAASRAAAYDASDPTSIDKVFISVISNF
jgi:Ca-activated chloride channel family protein